MESALLGLKVKIVEMVSIPPGVAGLRMREVFKKR